MFVIERSIAAINPPIATVGDWMIFAETWIISTEAFVSPIEGRYVAIEGRASRHHRRTTTPRHRRKIRNRSADQATLDGQRNGPSPMAPDDQRARLADGPGQTAGVCRAVRVGLLRTPGR